MENLVALFFYILAVLLVVTSLCVLFSKRIKTVLFYTLILFFGFGLLSLLLNCVYNGAVQIMLGCGGSILLLGFLAVLTPKKMPNEVKVSFRPRMLLSFGAVGMILLTFLWALFDNYLRRLLDIMSGSVQINREVSTVETISENIIAKYSIDIGVVAIILLLLAIGVGMVGIFKRNEEKM